MTRVFRDGDASIRPAMRCLELVAGLMQRIESQLTGSPVVPVVCLVALAFGVYFTADVLLQIYSLHPLIVFVAENW